MTMQPRTMEIAKKRRGNASLRATRTVHTLLDQMEDLARGARIKELREQLHLTQPAVAEMIPVSLRAYQAWEAGGGIAWENVKLLAKKLDADPDYILNGPKPETPDLLGVAQMDRLEDKLDAVIDMLLAERQDDAAQLRARLRATLARRDGSSAGSNREDPPAQGGHP